MQMPRRHTSMRRLTRCSDETARRFQRMIFGLPHWQFSIRSLFARETRISRSCPKLRAYRACPSSVENYLSAISTVTLKKLYPSRLSLGSSVQSLSSSDTLP